MHSLLKRQIRKFLDAEIKESETINSFLEAVNSSYQNYEEQFTMLQRAMAISSQELFDANRKLQLEAEEQKKVIASLTEATKTLRSVSFKKDKGDNESKELSGIELANLIEEQALQISKIEKQREILLKDLEKSNRDLNDYAHVVSHDLKSPLRTVNTLITWIREDNGDNLDKSTQDHLERIDSNIEKMDNLITGILEYSVVDDKTQNLKSEIILGPLIDEIIELTQIPDHITVETPKTLPIIHADSSRIKQLFQNLITNAIKAIDKEKGEVCVLFEELPDFWQFGIKDNGKGIPKKYHKKVFEIFQKLETKDKSTGIGLSIVKKIVAFYEGKIWIESQEGIGTTFFFTLKK